MKIRTTNPANPANPANKINLTKLVNLINLMNPILKMIKKFTILMLILPTVYAQGLGISPSNIDLKTFPGQNGQVQLRIYNLGKENFQVNFENDNEIFNFPPKIVVPANDYKNVNINYSIKKYEQEKILHEVIILKAEQTSLIQTNAEFIIRINISEKFEPKAKIADVVFGQKTKVIIENYGSTNSEFKIVFGKEEKIILLPSGTLREVIFENKARKIELYYKNKLLDSKTKNLITGMAVNLTENYIFSGVLMILLIIGFFLFRKK